MFAQARKEKNEEKKMNHKARDKDGIHLKKNKKVLLEISKDTLKQVEGKKTKDNQQKELKNFVGREFP